MSVCEICEKRRPRRYCPGVRNDICPICCGEEREVSVDCPFDCEFLQEARKRDKPQQLDPDDIPNKEIEVTDRFLRQNEPLLYTASQSLLQAAAETPGCVDTDIREALAAMIKTQLTLDSGLIYESKPSNPYAGAIQQRGVQPVRKLEQQPQDGV